MVSGVGTVTRAHRNKSKTREFYSLLRVELASIFCGRNKEITREYSTREGLNLNLRVFSTLISTDPEERQQWQQGESSPKLERKRLEKAIKWYFFP